MNKNRNPIWHNFATLSYFTLLAWILLWNIWLTPAYPAALVLVLLLGPLLLTLRGLLYARRNAYAVLSLLSPFYFALGISHAVIESPTRPYGLGLSALSIILFASCIGALRGNRTSSSS